MNRAITVEQLMDRLQQPAKVLILDVRKTHDFEADPRVIAGAERRLPDNVDAWLGTLPTDREIVVYCVHGHAVSQGVLDRLRTAKVNACYLQGGIEDWKAAGGATVVAAA